MSAHVQLEDGLVTQIKRNPRPELAMASPWQKNSESSGLAVGSRRSRAAAFGDDTIDTPVASTSGGRGRVTSVGSFKTLRPGIYPKGLQG